mmetsp:Transcript_27603/g.68196  ORF Transcript_27603/g.68196 Transcript_27603/m.68196 type:complete len:203 (-) Transcript_27603:20-628(-)
MCRKRLSRRQSGGTDVRCCGAWAALHALSRGPQRLLGTARRCALERLSQPEDFFLVLADVGAKVRLHLCQLRLRVRRAPCELCPLTLQVGLHARELAHLHLQLLRVVGTTEMHRARRLVGGGELRLHRLELRPEALRLRLRLRLARGARVVVRVVAALAQLLNLLQQRLLRRAQLLDQLRVGLRLAPALQLAHARLQRQGEG